VFHISKGTYFHRRKDQFSLYNLMYNTNQKWENVNPEKNVTHK